MPGHGLGLWADSASERNGTTRRNLAMQTFTSQLAQPLPAEQQGGERWSRRRSASSLTSAGSQERMTNGANGAQGSNVFDRVVVGRLDESNRCECENIKACTSKALPENGRPNVVEKVRRTSAKRNQSRLNEMPVSVDTSQLAHDEVHYRSVSFCFEVAPPLCSVF